MVMQANYATSRDMSGNSYGSFDKVAISPETRMRSEMVMMDKKALAMEKIIDIDREIVRGLHNERQLAALNRRRNTLLGVVALADYGLSA